jgi:formylglycine-generating enzyme required for sulfatase activity
MSTPDGNPAAPGALIAGLRLLRRRGAGSFGVVWEAEDTHDRGRRVAVKLVEPSKLDQPGFRASLEREVDLLMRLQHPHIVRVHRGVFVGEHAGFVMELLDGDDLEARLFGAGARGRLGVAEAEGLLEQALDALAYTHRPTSDRGVVLHRDIKPGNLILSPAGAVKLIDFGVARLREGSATSTHAFVGTFAYAAPEVLDAQRAQPSADLYALGLVGWELLTGQRACPGGSPAAQVRWHEATLPAPARSLRPEVPAYLDALLGALFAKDPAARPADAGVALALLRRLRAEAGAEAQKSARPATVVSGVAGRPPATVGPAAGGRATGGAPAAPAQAAPATVALASPTPAPAVAPTRSSPAPASPREPAPAPAPVAPAPSPAPPASPRSALPAAPASAAPAPHAGMSGRWLAVGSSLALVAVAGWWWTRPPARLAAPDPLPAPLAPSPADELPTQLVPSGWYSVGCTRGQADCFNDERPPRSVHLTRPVAAGRFEVTQGLYTLVMGANPSHFSACGPECPVESLNWTEAVQFANALSRRHGLEECYVINGDQVTWPKGPSCLGWRLPTEAEWEVAAAGGLDTLYAGGDQLGAVGWYGHNSGGTTHPVGQNAPNGYGLYDMSGNVWEWVWDWYASDAYAKGAATDPAGPASGSNRVARGGSWFLDPQYARVAFRSNGAPGFRSSNLGVRLLRTAG